MFRWSAKFACRHGADVHRAWAAEGLAPRLLHTEIIDSTDPMHLILMEWLPEAYLILDKLHSFDRLWSAAPTFSWLCNLLMAFS